jgi:hypothetical protein
VAGDRQVAQAGTWLLVLSLLSRNRPPITIVRPSRTITLS